MTGRTSAARVTVMAGAAVLCSFVFAGLAMPLDAYAMPYLDQCLKNGKKMVGGSCSDDGSGKNLEPDRKGHKFKAKPKAKRR